MKYLYATAALVVTACGSVYLFSQYNEWRQQQASRPTNALLNPRYRQCNSQAFKFFGQDDVLNDIKSYRNKRTWIFDYCMKSPLPVDKLIKSPLMVSFEADE